MKKIIKIFKTTIFRNILIFLISLIILIIPSLCIFNTPNGSYQGLDLELVGTDKTKLEKLLRDNVDKEIKVYSLGINTNMYRITKKDLSDSNLSKLSTTLNKYFKKDFSKNDIVKYTQKGDLKKVKLYILYGAISLVIVIILTLVIDKFIKIK